LAVGLVYQALLKQASMLAFIDCFWVLMVFVAVITPTIFLFRRDSKSDEPAKAVA
jgi:hypothetical protein